MHNPWTKKLKKCLTFSVPDFFFGKFKDFKYVVGLEILPKPGNHCKLNYLTDRRTNVCLKLLKTSH